MKLVWVDAFTNQPYRGNPAAVVFLERDASDAWMQATAREIGLSETAFVRGSDARYSLRWFTPSVEVDLCGHATLAAAHALWSEGCVDDSTPISFETRSGTLMATPRLNGIELDFPATPAEVCSGPDTLLEALKVTPTLVGRTRFDYLIMLASAAEVRALQPDFKQLAQVPTRGVIVTAPSDDDRYDYISRFFAPSAGIDEDPVTGSAHCCLGPFWSERLRRAQLVGYQASARGGQVVTEVRSDRVALIGSAVTILRGHLLTLPH